MCRKLQHNQIFWLACYTISIVTSSQLLKAYYDVTDAERAVFTKKCDWVISEAPSRKFFCQYEYDRFCLIFLFIGVWEFIQ